MKKLRIVVADGNLDYVESLAAYLRTAEESSRFVVTYFTSREKLEFYLAEEENIDILLISPEIYYNGLKVLHDTSVIFLDDDKLTVDRSDQNSLYRYQRLGQLVSGMLAIYYDRNLTAGKYLARSKQTQVLSVYSPVGGSGKTAVAVNLSKQLALNNAKVFYLNLELINTTSLYFSSNDDDPSLQVFYYVKSESPLLLSKIEALKKYDPYSMVDYFDIAINAEELLEFNESDVKRLINGIVETGSYDYIVVDLDSSLHERNIAALKECDQVVWPITNDKQSMLKTQSFFNEEEKLVGKENIIKDKLLILQNKYLDTGIRATNDFDVVIDGNLPFIENWLTAQSSSEILGNDLFNQELQGIIQSKIITGGRSAASIG
ncbi:AAA family ATPase [Oceanobacillus chungangensis]|uniref:AAA domain-containing protein n=1 Tax=Oceanobacillus chungangensis TaxID=1229152 RepID=A0A3D8Q0C6_9BACI|nr:AAA family ATPase [Oceanobacillus chungangensis]RDW21714.1 hypothetical protein CWR45_02235 [Oceanobacillus chungangensis]